MRGGRIQRAGSVRLTGADTEDRLEALAGNEKRLRDVRENLPLCRRTQRGLKKKAEAADGAGRISKAHSMRRQADFPRRKTPRPNEVGAGRKGKIPDVAPRFARSATQGGGDQKRIRRPERTS